MVVIDPTPMKANLKDILFQHSPSPNHWGTAHVISMKWDKIYGIFPPRYFCRKGNNLINFSLLEHSQVPGIPASNLAYWVLTYKNIQEMIVICQPLQKNLW